MDKYRIRFSKTEKMRFIGHLDLLKLFQRAIKRAGLPIAYSQGFNPHQLVVFALPLTLGHSSNGEYVELVFEKEIDPKCIVDALNKVMPVGLKILSARKLEEKEKGAASITQSARYEIEFPQIIDLEKCISHILEQHQIQIEKNTKGKIKEVDIRQDIFEIKLIANNPCKIEVMLSAGSGRNLKPELLAEYICKIEDVDYQKYKMKYTRQDLFAGSFKSLSETVSK